MNINSEENMKKLLQAVCKPVATSSEFKEGLLKRLTHKVSGEARESAIPLWKQAKLWVPIAAVLILAAIGYGIWLPQASAPIVTPPVTPPVSPPVAPPTLPPTVVSTGILEIRVTDAPPQHKVAEINVTLANIEVHKADDEMGGEGVWIMVIAEAKSFDLLQLRDIGVEEVLGEAQIPSGHYTQIRVDVELVDAIIDDERVDAGVVLPGGKLKFIASFEVDEGKKTILTLDFDADKSLVFTGEGKVIFKPVVKLMVTHEDENAAP